MEIRSWHDRGLEIEEEPRFHHASWRAERLGWSMLALVLLAALLGALGRGGPLATAEATGPSGITVEHERFPHYSAPSTVRVHLPADAAQDGEIRLRVDSRYLGDVRIESVTPLPLRVHAGADEQVYVFAAGGAAPGAIVFRVHMDRIGRLAGAVALDTRAPVRFDQFVFP